MSDCAVTLMLDAGFVHPDDPVDVYVETSTGLVHTSAPCAFSAGDGDRDVTGETRTFTSLLEVPADDRCRCVSRPLSYDRDPLTRDQTTALTHLLTPDTTGAVPMRKVSTFRANAYTLTHLPIPTNGVSELRAAARLAAADAVAAGDAYRLDAGFALLRAWRHLDRRMTRLVTPTRSQHALLDAGADAVDAVADDALVAAAFASVSYDDLVATTMQDEIPGVPDAGPAGPVGAVWDAARSSLMWAALDATRVGFASSALGWCTDVDPAGTHRVLVRVPTAVWWTGPGAVLIPLVDGRVPHADVAAAWRVADGDPARIEDAVAALTVART